MPGYILFFVSAMVQFFSDVLKTPGNNGIQPRYRRYLKDKVRIFFIFGPPGPGPVRTRGV